MLIYIRTCTLTSYNQCAPSQRRTVRRKVKQIAGHVVSYSAQNDHWLITNTAIVRIDADVGGMCPMAGVPASKTGTLDKVSVTCN